MRGFVDRLSALEGKDGVLSISVAHGFPWGDVPDAGTKIMVVTDGRPDAGARRAEALGRELIGLRGKTGAEFLGIDEGLDRALAVEGGPVVLSDGSDNPGGGAPCDSTYVLERLIARGLRSVALGPMWDPVAARFCFEAGEGARLRLRVGGKTCDLSGRPIDLEATVKRLVPDAQQTFGASRNALGNCAAIDADGIEIVLTSTRTQAFGRDLFTQFGIDLAAKKLIVVKSSQHFHAAFAPIAKAVLYLAAPGVLTADIASLPYRRIQRPIWPLDANA